MLKVSAHAVLPQPVACGGARREVGASKVIPTPVLKSEVAAVSDISS